MFSFLKHVETPPRALVYVTSLLPKEIELKQLLEGVELKCVPLHGLPTLESSDLTELATFRAREAYKILQCPLVIDESAMNLVDAVPNPGHLFKYFLKQLSDVGFAAHYKDREGTLEVVFAYTSDGITVHTFAGSLSGKIVSPPRVASPGLYCGWDAFWQPSGMQCTLAEAPLTMRHVMTHRQFAALNMRSFLFKMRFPGVYELHVTVAPTGDYEHFRSVCAELGHGSIDVVNLSSEGTMKPHQYQTKKYLVADSAADAIAIMFELSRNLKVRGFEPIRHRAEAMLHSREAPFEDRDTERFPATNYFEMHARILTPAMPAFEALSFVVEMGAKVSRVGEKTFINARFYGVGSSTAMRRWQSILDGLHDRGFHTKRIPEEYTVFDDQPHMDDD